MPNLLSSLTQEEVLEIDKLIKEEAHSANEWLITAGFPQSNYDAVVKYRDGYCGISSECALKYLSEKGFDMDKIKKINPAGDLGGDTHYLVSDGIHILEPSYKQFLYTSVLDREESYNPKEGISDKNIAEIENLPGVFLGTPQELKEQITKILMAVNQEERIGIVLSNYGLLVKDEELSLESTNESSDNELQSPLLKGKSISFKEEYQKQKEEIDNVIDQEYKGPMFS